MKMRFLAVLVATLLAAPCLAGEQDADGDAAVRSLKPELSVQQSLFMPSQPILARFTLFNPLDKPVSLVIDSTSDASEGISLPRSLVLGDPDRPAITVSFESQPLTPLQPAQGAGETSRETFRLAPHASIGAELDLASLSRMFRYSGQYVVEWRPLGELTAPATISFRVEQRKDAVLVTDYGKVTFSLMYDQAPKNVANFLELARRRYYDGKTIHRLIPNFIMQGGSPDGSPNGIRPDGKLIEGEFHAAPFELGTLAMARKPSDPDSASCQFFVSLARLPELDGKYTAIGRATDEESRRTLQRINELPTTESGRPIRPMIIRFITLQTPVERRPSPSGELETITP